MRSRFALLLSLLVAGIGVIGLAPTAQAADDAYSYWLYYTVEDGKFSYQETEGPSSFVPEDGSIEAYRFASSVFPPTQEPRADLSEVNFDTVCGDTAAEDGKKRVAVLLDYGVQQDAKGGEAPPPIAACASVPTDAHGMQVLMTVADARTGDKASLCAINGYPETGCFEPAAKQTPKDGDPVEFAIAGSDGDTEADAKGDAAKDDDGNNALLLGGAAVLIVVLAGGGILLNRRRSAA